MLAAHLAKVCLRHLLPLFIKETAGEITSLAQNRDFVYFSKIPLSPCKSNANWNLKTKYSDCLVFLSRQRTREGMVHYQSQVQTSGLSQDLWTNFRARGKEFENMQDIAKKFSKQRGRRDWRTFFQENDQICCTLSGPVVSLHQIWKKDLQSFREAWLITEDKCCQPAWIFWIFLMNLPILFCTNIAKGTTDPRVEFILPK